MGLSALFGCERKKVSAPWMPGLPSHQPRRALKKVRARVTKGDGEK
jgi:hypothetical protein